MVRLMSRIIASAVIAVLPVTSFTLAAVPNSHSDAGMPARAATEVQSVRATKVPVPVLPAAAQMTTSPDALANHGVAYLLGPGGSQGPRVTFPACAATANAIRRFAAKSVSHRPNRCATSLGEAMGWCLGDAHDWMRLPTQGFTMRQPGTAAQPGDVLVWPFTFGRRGSQHVGLCVGTDQGNRLLSNLTGDICLSELVPGYRAFHKEPMAPVGELAGMVKAGTGG
jgi:hypothetical protein